MAEDIEQLRVRGIDLARRQADGDAELLALRPQLEQDTKLWWTLWAPSCALAALRLGDPDEAWRLLDAAVANGLHQHEMFELADLFGNDPRWPDLLRRLEANIPPAPIELLDWPDPVPSLPVALFRAAPAREAELRRRVPRPQPSAWRTALDMLRWVHTRWEHTSTNHALNEDAVTILDRVAEGERFACREYTVTLTQVLNAVGIAAREVSVRAENYHAGVGTGHMISEAFIDDLGRWVALDGQNGAVWSDDGVDEALGTLELHRRFLAGGPQPRLIGLVKEFDQAETDEWWRYFGGFGVTGQKFATTFVPFFENSYLHTADRLVRDPARAYPDLRQAAIGIGGRFEQPAITVLTAHPFARGFVVTCDGKRTELSLDAPQWPIDATPGDHRAEIAVVTPYGEFPAGAVTYYAV